jgi:transcriptional regulator with XRE-family HTH domain
MSTRLREWLQSQPTGTRDRLCEDVGISYRTLLRYEAGEREPDIATAIKIQAFTGSAVSIADLSRAAISEMPCHDDGERKPCEVAR